MHPVLFQFHGMTIYSYGFFTALAMVVALFLAEKRAKSFGLEAAQVADILFILFIAGIVGARAFYVWQHFEDYTSDLWAIVRIQEGGLVWYGGLFSAIFLGSLYARWRGWPILKLCDFFSPISALAHGIGRIGCFFNGCCYGIAKLPTQLFEALGLFMISGVLFYLLPKPHKEGKIFLFYLLFYSMLRFVMEFLRGDNKHFFYLTLPQWMSLGLFLSALLFLNKQKTSQ